MNGKLKMGAVGFLVFCLTLLTACSSTPSSSSIEINPDPRDPYQNFNRKVYAFNDTLDKNVLVPVVNVYEAITPNFVEKGVSNFFSNLRELNNFLHHSLQLKPVGAVKDLSRLAINTTIGLLGFFDLATTFGIYQESEDLGQTLGYWGVGSGPYIVLPFLGPSSLRDASGTVITIVASPVAQYNPVAGKLPITALELIDLRHQLGDFGSLISGDSYVFVREAYLQRREYMVNGGEVDDDDFDDF